MVHAWTASFVSVLLLATSACSSAPGDGGQQDRTEKRGRTATSAAEQPETGGPASPVTPTGPSATAPAVTAPPAARATIATIDETIAARMSASWRPGCPVPLASLRLVTIQHWTFEGDVRTGELVVAADHAEATVGVFGALLAARFPIAQVRLIDEYGGDDDRSMAANNTSGFNCRRAVGSTSRWSEHAYGTAIDINPIQNPYVTGSGRVLPPQGAAYVERDPTIPGVIVAAGPVVAAFAEIGWSWGGDWSQAKDYQHFSASGR